MILGSIKMKKNIHFCGILKFIYYVYDKYIIKEHIF